MVHFVTVVIMKGLKRFSPGFQQVIGFALLRYMIGLKNSRNFFIQSKPKPKRTVTRSHAFSRALRQLQVITSSFDWFTVLSVSLFWFWFYSIENHSIENFSIEYRKTKTKTKPTSYQLDNSASHKTTVKPKLK